MKKIGFIGLGNMGYYMSKNLCKKEMQIYGYDINKSALEKIKNTEVKPCKTLREVSQDKSIIITMLPDGEAVKKVWNEILPFLKKDTIVVDCSTIEVNITKKLQEAYQNQEISTLDAPVSGGTKGAENGTLTFMVGGKKEIYEQVIPIFETMGKKSILCGKSGSGQSAKLCNNLLLAITMKGLGETLKLANSLDVDLKKLFEILSTSTGSCWAVNSYFPVKNIGPVSPADNNFNPGFSSKLMHKDLSLAIEEAKMNNLELDFGTKILKEYKVALSNGKGDLDFSNIVNL